MKKYILISISFFFLVGSCSLETENPNDTASSEFWVNEKAATEGLIAVYNTLGRLGTYKIWFHCVTDARSDEAFSRSPWPDLSNVSKFTFTDYNFVTNYDVFHDHYRGIYRANQVIFNLPDIEMDDVLKSRYIAEAKFLRALYYYNLVNLYGDVPLIDTLLVSTEGMPQQGTEAIWNLIIKDLNSAQTYLPEKYDDSENHELGRATWGAATGLLAKCYMQMHEWGLAADQLEDIIDSRIYGLDPVFANNFDMLNGENNVESLFEVQFSDVFPIGWHEEAYASAPLGCAKGRFFSPIGWSDWEATSFLLDAFKAYGQKYLGDPLGDLRLDVSLIHPESKDTFYGGRVYQQLQFRNSSARGSQWLRKYLADNYVTDAETDNFATNIKVIRYADILLLYAEALNNLGTGNPLDYINMVRNRSFIPDLEGTYSKEELQSIIEEERLIELSGENQRFFDLMRWGYLDDPEKIEILKNNDPEFSNFEPYKKYLPIPTSEVDLNSGVEQSGNW
ncbi:MAG: RagB/SusD family nutrient uptake outer membrane protein [Bacteroidales bacterium]|nr:RagB/SusD family nutrient uptake outer membrane protein [Bacteroidales bacterium]